MPKKRIVFCDTGFIIKLLDRNSDFHSNAFGYYQYFLEQGYSLRMSTIAVAEYCVYGNIEEIPLKNILLSPFNAYRASEAGNCAKVLYDARSKGIIQVNSRVLILNDVKMFTQAQCEEAEYYLTADKDSRKMYNILRDAEKIDFDFIYIGTSYKQKFGFLDIQE